MHSINSVAIVGGGAAAYACAKYLQAEKAFQRIDVFEQRSDLGGTWNYTPENDAEATFTVPQTTPFLPLESPLWRKQGRESRQNVETNGQKDSPNGEYVEAVATFVSPMHERLEANLPKWLMQFSDTPYSEDTALMPKRETVNEYLEDYARDIRHLIRLETQVTRIERHLDRVAERWTVSTKNIRTGKAEETTYDAVAVCNGHYNVPYIPEVKGIREWNAAYPGCIIHSKYFRRREDYAGKKVLVIGKGFSGLDIVQHVETVAKPPLLHSARTRTSDAELTTTRLPLPAVSEFLMSTKDGPRAILFEDGRIETDIDAVIYCTGYLYSYPFLGEHCLDPPVISNKPNTRGLRTQNTYLHLFYIYDPSIVFLSLPQKVVPFQLSESQSALIAGIWSRRLKLPNIAEMQRWERNQLEEKEDSSKFHYLDPPQDKEYINMIYEWVMGKDADERPTSERPQAERAVTRPDGVGKEPPRWGDLELWARSIMLHVRQKWFALGEERFNITSLAELGFHFDDWKQQNVATK